MDDELEMLKAKKLREILSFRKKEPFSNYLPVKITDTNFQDFIARNRSAVVDCWAEWCSPCHMLSPIIDKLAEDYQSKIAFGKLNVDENPEISMKYGIMSIPTLLFFKNGNLIDTIVGVAPKLSIERKLAELI